MVGGGVALVRALTSIADLKGENEDQNVGIAIAMASEGLLTLPAGIALAVKSLRPEIQVIGVEPDEAPCMYEALRRGRLRLLWLRLAGPFFALRPRSARS